MPKTQPVTRSGFRKTVLFHHLLFTVSSALVLILVFLLLRIALFLYNRELMGNTPAADFYEAFGNGLRFDLRLTVYICVPLLLSVLSLRAMVARRAHRVWLGVCASIALFLGLLELDFYREFHQRLNGLVFQYISEDPQTVMSMLWYGFPVVRYLLVWVLATASVICLLRAVDIKTRPTRPGAGWWLTFDTAAPWYQRTVVFVVCLLVAVLAARGTLRQGPPLRWGDAYTTDSAFANQLGLNGTLTLVRAARAHWSPARDNIWKPTLPESEALQQVRSMLLTDREQLVDRDTAAVRRTLSPAPGDTVPVRNVVVILMESFAGHYVGALGGKGGITPNFDRLAQQGLLFTRFFSNGTHTHQGMFATMACFPNLPGFEYLMQQPEGGHRFSGLPQLLGSRGYDDLYVYNGDFAWDNQRGFFGNQGMSRFIGRGDYVNPVFSDPTWGVSDQDMFDRAIIEMQKMEGGKPFYALLQTLSNHMPYALPENLPVAPVTGFGSLNEHLTAMRYSDWALGRFFEKVRQLPMFDNTLFVVVGDHGFGGPEQLSDIDLYRFHVPLLLIGPGIQQTFGPQNDLVGTQVDIVPTIMGRLGGEVQHQCWGRDLLSLAKQDRGIGVIKPSGSDQTVALLAGDRLLVQPRGGEPQLYRYQLHQNAGVTRLQEPEKLKELKKTLEAFLQVATDSLLSNSAGATTGRS